MNKVVRDEIVNAMQNILDNISPVNIKLQKIQMGRLFDLYADYNELFPYVEDDNEKERKMSLVKTIPEPKTKLDKQNKVMVGYLVRDLVGGSIIVDGYTVKVREKVCRDMNLVHGDLLRTNFENYQSLSVTKLEDSNTEYESYREVLPYCVISDDSEDDELIVATHIKNGEIVKIPILEEHDFVFHISDFERKKFALQVGDVVDIAYHRDYPKTYKIAWKYNNQQQERVFKL